MKRHWLLRGLKILVIAALAATVFSFVVMELWNWLAPAIFGLHTISFWQALGLLVLSKILFGGFHGRHGFGGRWRQRMMERWEQMTPECAVAAAPSDPHRPRPPLPHPGSSGERGRPPEIMKALRRIVYEVRSLSYAEPPVSPCWLYENLRR
jgi:hypothetical protein